MIVWQGLGFLAVLIPVIFLVAADLIFGKGFLDAQTYGNETVALVSAIIVWFVGTKLNNVPGKVLIDPETNQEVILKNKHTIFWVPMQWFSLILGGAAFFIFIKHFS